MSSTSTLSRCGTVAILLAAGEGLRSGGRKQFRKSGGRSILRHAAEGLAAVREVGGLMVVVPEDAIASVRLDLASLNCPIDVVAGGTTRNESSRRGMAALPARCRWVLIHDAALASTRWIDFTDDASVVIHSGKGVAVVEGEPANIKITTPAELSRALRELRQSGRIRG
jgi:2-C-methyl-D-erythritol 4-phosphate cytidylyltransferase